MPARWTSTVILAAALVLPASADAEPPPGRGITLGLAAVQPLPPWNDAGFGAGIWAGFVLPASASWSLTARAGYLRHLDKQLTVGSAATESVSYGNWELPVLAGVEYAGSSLKGFLVSGEVGYVLHGSHADYAHEADQSSVDHSAGVAIGAGYRYRRFEARVHWVMLGLPDPVKQKAVMLGVQWLLPI